MSQDQLHILTRKVLLAAANVHQVPSDDLDGLGELAPNTEITDRAQSQEGLLNMLRLLLESGEVFFNNLRNLAEALSGLAIENGEPAAMDHLFEAFQGLDPRQIDDASHNLGEFTTAADTDLSSLLATLCALSAHLRNSRTVEA